MNKDARRDGAPRSLQPAGRAHACTAGPGQPPVPHAAGEQRLVQSAGSRNAGASYLLLLLWLQLKSRVRIQDANAKNQEIFYATRTSLGRCPDSPEDMAPIDLDGALAKTLDLAVVDLTYMSDEDVGITLYNQRNFDSLHAFRTSDDRWHLDFPIFGGDPVYRFTNIADTDTRRVVDIIRAFFEDGDWRGLANFKFARDQLEVNIASRDGLYHPYFEHVRRDNERRARAMRARAMRAHGRGPLDSLAGSHASP